jgi:hypothetical protein
VKGLQKSFLVVFLSLALLALAGSAQARESAFSPRVRPGGGALHVSLKSQGLTAPVPAGTPAPAQNLNRQQPSAEQHYISSQSLLNRRQHQETASVQEPSYPAARPVSVPDSPPSPDSASASAGPGEKGPDQGPAPSGPQTRLEEYRKTHPGAKLYTGIFLPEEGKIIGLDGNPDIVVSDPAPATEKKNSPKPAVGNKASGEDPFLEEAQKNDPDAERIGDWIYSPKTGNSEYLPLR